MDVSHFLLYVCTFCLLIFDSNKWIVLLVKHIIAIVNTLEIVVLQPPCMTAQNAFYKLGNAPKSISAGASPWTPLGELTAELEESRGL